MIEQKKTPSLIMALSLISLIIISCEGNKTSLNNPLYQLEYDSISKTLIIDFDSIQNIDIKKIEVNTEKNLKHVLELDTNKQIVQLYNLISTQGRGYDANTWYKFDKQVNIIESKSFYFNTFMTTSKDGCENYIAYKKLFNLYGGEHYAVVGNYDNYFNLLDTKNVDTFMMDPVNNLILIPFNALESKEGKHNIKFVVYEDLRKGDTITRHRTFIDRDFFVVHE